ncbi:hypothetical protein [Leekyejoonella antrihumi]|uniref:DUF2079 domain-containing protein n=1 Tax=Leekyejoonella antrihumi TaxID=1660198 RepID=A0A563DVG2_9MICO|nr:hypothetical protein [Leekyejoonella antrihumi]TWP34196.1 hypothetical protein FGL98_18210 [Leekyejoonella antrihumi]
MTDVGVRSESRIRLPSSMAGRSVRASVAWIVTVMLVLPLFWWTASLIARGWIPQGDQALIAIGSHDVFSTHPPLLGMRSTSSLTAPGVYAHHPGPLQFYVLALPYLLTAYHPFGILLGCLATTLAFVALALHSAHRAAALPGLLVATGVIAVLELQFGEELVLPLNMWPPIIGLVAVQMLGWRLFLGQLSALPWYAVCASYVAQVHIEFAPVVGLLTVALLLTGLVRWRRRRGAFWPLPGFRRQSEAPRWRRHGWVTSALVLVCWFPVLVDLVKDSPSNATELLRMATTPSPKSVGLGFRGCTS